jgi:ribosomal protein L7/L12
MIEKGAVTHECFVLASRAAEMIFMVADKEEEKVSSYIYKVFLVSHGNKKIHCIRAIREFINLGLKEAKLLVDSVPRALLETTDFDEAWGLYSKLLSPPMWKNTQNDPVICELSRTAEKCSDLYEWKDAPHPQAE